MRYVRVLDNQVEEGVALSHTVPAQVTILILWFLDKLSTLIDKLMSTLINFDIDLGDWSTLTCTLAYLFYKRLHSLDVCYY